MKIQKNLVLILIMGIAYCFFETAFRAATFQCQPLYPNFWSLYGSVSLWMLPIGGLIGLWIGELNEWLWTRNFPVWVQAIIAAGVIYSVEFVSGFILNVWPFQLNIWSYAGLPGNLLGQIWIGFAPLWILLSPFAMWLDDTLEIDVYHNQDRKPYTLADIYASLFTGK